MAILLSFWLLNGMFYSEGDSSYSFGWIYCSYLRIAENVAPKIQVEYLCSLAVLLDLRIKMSPGYKKWITRFLYRGSADKMLNAASFDFPIIPMCSKTELFVLCSPVFCFIYNGQVLPIYWSIINSSGTSHHSSGSFDKSLYFVGMR